ncbi:hypothetical protein B0H11DRAFT_2032380 [Mycena galericulata]|nr:hypothetical protein B0H11DRAFT_2111587 [Mycena galericulata]KAJ7475488.1 hypothetical protein B0H11DRAFT_2032380 [Mycena galericulata]
MGINELTAPPGTANVLVQSIQVFSNAKINLPDGWSGHPGTISWAIRCYCYKEVESGVRFVMLHSGSTDTIIADVRLKHEIKIVGNVGGFEKHLPTNGVADGLTHKYNIDYAETMNLQKRDSNEFAFNAKYQDAYTRYGFIQTGENLSQSVRFILKKDPGYGRQLEDPKAFTQPIHGLSEFFCPVQSTGKYEFEFEFSIDAGAAATTTKHKISLPVEEIEFA